MRRTNLGALCTFIAAVACNPALAATEAPANPACMALLQARGLPVPVLTAMLGDAAMFPLLSARVNALVHGPFTAIVGPVAEPTVTHLQRNAVLFLSKQDALRKTHEALQSIRKASPPLLLDAEEVVTHELLDDARPSRVTAAGQLVMLTQRIGKSAAEMITIQGLDPESVFLLGKDTQSFKLLLRGLREGHSDLRIPPPKTAAQKQRLTALAQTFERTAQDTAAVLAVLKDLVAAREAQAQLLVDVAELDRLLEPICAGAQTLE